MSLRLAPAYLAAAASLGLAAARDCEGQVEPRHLEPVSASPRVTRRLTRPDGRDRITLPEVGAFGVFDPSIRADGARVWMSYSAVETPQTLFCPSATTSTISRVTTRLAYSDDQGVTWTDIALVNDAPTICLGAPLVVGVWQAEVSSLVKDPAAPPDERWKLFYHRYLWVKDSSADNRRFEAGWIARRAAGRPDLLPAAPERKLFVGSGYDPAFDVVGGAPMIALDRLDVALNPCLVFTEPGGLSSGGDLFLALSCASSTPQDSKLVLIAQGGGQWRYVGTLLNAADGLALGSTGPPTAADLFVVGAQAYLLATRTLADRYDGCLVFGADLPTARVAREPTGRPKVLLELRPMIAGSHSGACAYEPLARQSGILFGEVDTSTGVPSFQIFRSHVNIPDALPTAQ